MTENDPLAAQLLLLVRALDPVTEQALDAARGATLSQLAALRCLSHGGLTVSALAAELGTHRSSASRLVDRLVAHGLATKSQSPVSGREVLVHATSKGRGAAKRVGDLRLSSLAGMLSSLTPEERAAVEAALTVLLRVAPRR